MQFTRKSRIADIVKHPAGQDLLRDALRRAGKPEDWPSKAVPGRMRVAALDKLVNPEFTDCLLQIVNIPQEMPKDITAAPAWWKEGVAYQIYVPSFMDSDHDGVGDIGGVVQRLPYLERLGVDILWLSSIDVMGIDREEPAQAEQEPEVLAAAETLIEAAHERGMRVVAAIDLGGFTTARRWFEGGDTAARAHLRGTLEFWAGRGVDGFCLEGVRGERGDCLPDAACFGPQLHHALHALRGALGESNCTMLAGGIDGVGPQCAKLFTAPSRGELDLVVDTGHLHTPPSILQMFLEGRGIGKKQPEGVSLPRLKKYYSEWMEANGDTYWMPLVFETPSLPRIISRTGASPVYRTVLAKLFATWMLTLRGTPLLYQGEELGLANTRFSSPEEIGDEVFKTLYGEMKKKLDDRTAFDLAQRIAADHARVPMPWSTGAGAGFTGAMPWKRLPDGIEHLNAAYQMGDTASVWSHYSTLIGLRRANPGLVYGSCKPVFTKNKRVFCFFRLHEGEKWYVEMNLTGSEVPRPGRIGQGHRLLVSNYDNPAKHLRPYEANLYKVEG